LNAPQSIPITKSSLNAAIFANFCRATKFYSEKQTILLIDTVFFYLSAQNEQARNCLRAYKKAFQEKMIFRTSGP
jgi:hypothetical protein